MFFNQPIIIETKKNRVSAQIDFNLPNYYFSSGNIIYLPAVKLWQSPVATKTQPFQEQQQKNGWEIAADILCAVGLGVLIGGALVLTGAAIVEMLRLRRNSVPLTPGMRRYIRERDEEICFYCGDYAPDGHVDHRISRNNGGSNEPENLTWACVFDNCSKGALNDTEYIAFLQECY
jgi:hypothetical protein